MPKKNSKCTHDIFMETGEFSGKYKCTECFKIIDINETVDILNGEHKTIKDVYFQITTLVRKGN